MKTEAIALAVVLLSITANAAETKTMEQVQQDVAELNTGSA
jgi:hypothetical protein